MAFRGSGREGLLTHCFDRPLWNSRIPSSGGTKKELWLGYVLGPFGVMVLQSVVSSYFNQYLTDVLGFTAARGAWIAGFMVVFPLCARLLDAATNVLMARLMDRTACRQGKLRPWFLLSLPVIVISVLLMFRIPFEDTKLQALWVAVSYLLFYSVGYTMWNTAYEMSAALSTRDIRRRRKHALAGQITGNMGTGLFSILFPSILMAAVQLLGGDSRKGYFLCMSLLCCLAVPLTFVQYFYTRERVTEEYPGQPAAESGHAASPARQASFRVQLQACLKDRQWVLLVLMLLFYQVTNGMKLVSQVYYAAWVVEGNSYGSYAAVQARFAMIAMAPMGLALPLVLLLFRRFGYSKIIIAGSVLAVSGGMAACLGAGRPVMVYAGTAAGSAGAMTYIYALTAFVGDAIDHVEYSGGLRVEGVTAAVIGFAEVLAKGLGTALFNLGLTITGYTVPERIGTLVANGISTPVYADQPAAATVWINLSYSGVMVAQGILFFIMFVFFFRLEKEMPAVEKALKKRRESVYGEQDGMKAEVSGK